MSDRPSMFDMNLPCDDCGKNLAAIHVCSGCNDALRESLRLEREARERAEERAVPQETFDQMKIWWLGSQKELTAEREKTAMLREALLVVADWIPDLDHHESDCPGDCEGHASKWVVNRALAASPDKEGGK